MSDFDTDVLVIGTGPGGEGVSMQAVKQNYTVKVVERYKSVGGGCTHWGTIPSKALRRSIASVTDFYRNAWLSVADRQSVPSFPELRKTAAGVISQQTEMRTNFYLRNNVPIEFGHARLIDQHTVEVNGECSTAKNIVIATGSRPYRPPTVDFTHPRIFDSDTILNLSFTPKSISIYGAGVVGCEYASMFRNLGVKVNLINTRDQLLDFLDDEIADALSYHLREQGVLIRHGEQVEEIKGDDRGVLLRLKSGKRIKDDVLLWANGRSGNTDELGLDNVNLAPNSRGQLEVNEYFQTSVDNIYAVGDVVGYPSLASAAYMQGRAAGNHIAFGNDAKALSLDLIPTGIYTSPEISSIGLNERELTEKKIPYEVGQANFKSLALAQITGQRVGMLKILFCPDSHAILGVHCFGDSAAEIVHIGQAIMAQEGKANTLMYFINTTFNYPTMAEAYRVAALNGYNRLF
ncbi:MAG: NAD(P) transhydrogenase [Pirellulaceae bacterium]|jgi:NAD(P) transhydrogenase